MIPNKIHDLDSDTKRQWVNAYEEAKKVADPEKAVIYANKQVIDDHNYNTPSNNEVETFEADMVEHNGELLKRDASGEIFFDAILGDTSTHKDGKKFSQNVLEKWKNQINENQFAGDIDHAMFDKMLETVGDIQGNIPRIKSMLKNKPGITKKVKAFVEDGVLRIRSWIDKRYKKILQKANGLSIEANTQINEDTGEIVDGDLFGYTFNVNTEPAVNSAKIERIGDSDE